MNKKEDAYLWCSGPTDQTGSLLAEKLGIRWGTKKPNLKTTPLIIGWGTKTKEIINVGVPTINHPNKILSSRNKLGALEIMTKNGIAIPSFIKTATVLDELKNTKSNTIKLPVIGRTKFHQGGKGMWSCPTMSQVYTAIKDGAQYFQNMVSVNTEYRLHVVGDEVIYAVKKTQRSESEMKAAFVEKELKRQKALAEKNKDAFDDKVVKKVLERQTKNMTVDHISRANTRGWKFSRVTKYPRDLASHAIGEDLASHAIGAVKALGLEFGAVDCCIDLDSSVWIIEVNTGPGLEGSSLDAYVSKFTKMINKVLNPKPVDTTINAMLSAKDERPHKKAVKNTNLRTNMMSKTTIMSEMISKANDEQLVALKGVFNNMFD